MAYPRQQNSINEFQNKSFMKIIAVVITYNRLDLLKNFKGKNFIQLEILFYKQQLENLYNNLISHP